MNITSLLITLAGIIFIVALYIISRISQSKLPKNTATRIPNIKDENGERFTSVLDDIPARDGSTPVPDMTVNEETAQDNQADTQTDQQEEDDDEAQAATHTPANDDKEDAASKQRQHILFITPRNEEGLDGSLVQKVLQKNGLVLGDMDIYHYFPVMDPNQDDEKYSLFRVANGMAPWTLKPEDLLGKKLAGLSVVIITPTKINDSEAISLFISLSERICKQLGGVLKNQQQQLFTASDKKDLIYLYK